MRLLAFLFLALLCATTVHSQSPVKQPGLMKSEFIFENAPFPSSHASTIAETPTGLVAAWFGGSDEGEPDVGIWLSRHEHGKWTVPKEIVNGVQTSGKRYPCWNPVLFQMPQGVLLLFYKVGPSPSEWWGMLTKSQDGGKTWANAQRLPDGILGPIKNKPILLADGTLLCPTSSEDKGWRVHFETTKDEGKIWQKTTPINDGKEFGAIQPSILKHPDGRLQILCRSSNGFILQAFSTNQGNTWSTLSRTTLPNPNAGTDASTLQDGRHILVYNHSGKPDNDFDGKRTPLNVAISPDGKKWYAAAVLENVPGEYSYPAVIQGKDGLIHITYTWKRKLIKHAVIDINKCNLQEIKDGKWPAK
jgi:predicted neuraminidase